MSKPKPLTVDPAMPSILFASGTDHDTLACILGLLKEADLTVEIVYNLNSPVCCGVIRDVGEVALTLSLQGSGERAHVSYDDIRCIVIA
jgi:hypothetical protein